MSGEDFDIRGTELCIELNEQNPVRMFCEKARRLAQHDYFYEAERSLEQAYSFVGTPEERDCYKAYQKQIGELRKQRIVKLKKDVSGALQTDEKEATYDLNLRVEKALVVLQNLVSYSEIQRHRERWRNHYNDMVKRRKKSFEDTLRKARRLAKEEKLEEAQQYLNSARALADRDAEGRINYLARQIRQSHLRILRQLLEEAHSLSGQECFDDALVALREAYKLPLTTKDDEVDIQVVEKEIEENRWQRIQILTNEMENLLRRKPEELTQTDLDKGRELLTSLNKIHPTPTDLEETIARPWQTLHDREIARLDLENTRQQLAVLWQSPYLILSQHDQALSLAGQKAEASQGKFLSKEFQSLLTEAQLRREDAYKREGDIITQAAQGDFGVLVQELERFGTEGYEELPWYEWSTREHGGRREHALAPSHNVPAQDAIQRINELAMEYDDKKAEEYIQRARAVLETDPLGAEQWLKEAMDFKYLSQTRRQELKRYHDEVVVLARERHHQALDLVNVARSCREQDIAKAWRFVGIAYELAPGSREVTRLRDDLRPWFAVHLDGVLRQAEETMWEQNCEGAIQLAQAVLDDIQETQNLFQDAYKKAHKVLDQCRDKGELQNV